MKRGEIWLVISDPTSGQEQQDIRQVMVISPETFNNITRAPVILPITMHGEFARTAGFAVPLDNYRTRTKGVVRCDQPRATSIGSRKWRFIETAPDNVVAEVMARVNTIFEF